MLSAKYFTYKHTETNDLAVRTLSYRLPADLHDHIDLIQPTTMFDNMREMRATFHINEEAEDSASDSEDMALGSFVQGPAGQNISASCNTTVTPTCLMQLYRTEGYVPQAAKKGNRIGINGFLEQVNLFILVSRSFHLLTYGDLSM